MKRDLLQECNDRGENPQVFQKVFCRVCRNRQCTNSRWGDSEWLNRMDTQVDRMFGDARNVVPVGVDPRFAFLVDFQDRFQEAMALEVSSRNGDWEVPAMFQGKVPENLKAVKQHIEDKKPDPTEALILEELSAPVSEVEASVQEPTTEQAVSEEAPVVSNPPPVATYRSTNTPVPSEGIMLGGKPSTPTVKQSTAPVDPWAAPPQIKNLVPIGAKIKLGGDKKK